MPRTRFSPSGAFLPLLLSLLCGLHLGTAVGSPGEDPHADAAGGVASPPAPAAATTPADDAATEGRGSETAKTLDEELEALRDLSLNGHYAECEAGARKLLSRVESTAGSESRETSQILEILVMSLWRGGKAGEKETRELAAASSAFRSERDRTVRVSRRSGVPCLLPPPWSPS